MVYESQSTPIHPIPLPRQDYRSNSGLKSIERIGDFIKCYEKLTQHCIKPCYFIVLVLTIVEVVVLIVLVVVIVVVEEVVLVIVVVIVILVVVVVVVVIIVVIVVAAELISMILSPLAKP
ncbi:hypothetical protein ElyMa_003599100 [Elysia marginata]|uniref:ABC transmembrane type-1 domain-containing protein n=1 Tax=Elysia marginata TaxID=1093978 RepID=A0AAV4ER03_9GAST|nr:hypothetical protein ElyMa_003599100 [Elysia marginata]